MVDLPELLSQQNIEEKLQQRLLQIKWMDTIFPM